MEINFRPASLAASIRTSRRSAHAACTTCRMNPWGVRSHAAEASATSRASVGLTYNLNSVLIVKVAS